jgi:hypothetical protein
MARGYSTRPSSVKTSNVTGPSPTISTSIFAPKRPVATGSPASRNRWATRSYRASARGGSSAAAAVDLAGQGELADDQAPASDGREVEVHRRAPGEDAQPRDLVGRRVGIGLGIPGQHPDQQHHALLDLADDLAVDTHAGTRHPLQHGLHPPKLPAWW